MAKQTSTIIAGIVVGAVLLLLVIPCCVASFFVFREQKGQVEVEELEKRVVPNRPGRGP